MTYPGAYSAYSYDPQQQYSSYAPPNYPPPLQQEYGHYPPPPPPQQSYGQYPPPPQQPYDGYTLSSYPPPSQEYGNYPPSPPAQHYNGHSSSPQQQRSPHPTQTPYDNYPPPFSVSFLFFYCLMKLKPSYRILPNSLDNTFILLLIQVYILF